jgi:hypothetical protein
MITTYALRVKSQGGRLRGGDVSLARKLDVSMPAEGTEVSTTPTLRWEAFPNARFYRVVVTDMATMNGLVAADTRETSLTVLSRQRCAEADSLRQRRGAIKPQYLIRAGFRCLGRPVRAMLTDDAP